MAEPIDLIVPLPREMRSESAQRHTEVLARLGKLEQAQVSKQALTADALMSKLVTGELDERIFERKMRQPEGRK